jgi:hypothetical protein
MDPPIEAAIKGSRQTWGYRSLTLKRSRRDPGVWPPGALRSGCVMGYSARNGPDHPRAEDVRSLSARRSVVRAESGSTAEGVGVAAAATCADVSVAARLNLQVRTAIAAVPLPPVALNEYTDAICAEQGR